MSRNHRRLRVFCRADELAVATYDLTKDMSSTERYGLQAQLRRAAVSVPANIVEGAGRHSAGDFARFLELARGSACECSYLLDLAHRLNQLPAKALEVSAAYEGLSIGLHKAITYLRAHRNERSPARAD